MKITKSQLRKIIQEEKHALLNERGTGIPDLRPEEQVLTRAVTDFVDKYMLIMGMNPSDDADMQRAGRAVDDLVRAVMDVL